MKIIISTLLALSFQSQAAQDPLFVQQWALHNDGTQTVPIDEDDLHTLIQKGKAGVDIGWSQAQAQLLSFEKNPITVAVIDYGIDPTHPDLQGRISADGYDFLNKTNQLSDDEGHGTHVSGIIAANSGNSIGISGITGPMIKILPIRILNKQFNNFSYNNRLISDYAADAIEYAIQKKASVINMSLGWPQLVDSARAKKAVEDAIAAGIVVVAAAGNDIKQQPTYPCAYTGVICVGAVSNNGELSLYSNWGGKVDLLAPGDYIVSTYAQNLESNSLRLPGYEALSGTSQAAPMVSSMAAILKSNNPQMSVKEVVARILSSTNAPPNYKGMPAAQYGVANLSKLLLSPTRPVYQVDFKSMSDILVDEKSLQANGSLSLNNLFGAATHFNAVLKINGKMAGQQLLGNMSSGSSVQIPWKYQFSSLNDSADLKFVLEVVDDQGTKKQFVANLVAERNSLSIQGSQQISVSSAAAATTDWIGNNSLGRLATRMTLVSYYGQSYGAPEYYRIKSKGSAGMAIEVFLGASNGGLQQINIPNALGIVEVIHFRNHLSNDWEWAITSLGQDQNKSYYFQFYFLDKNFAPYSATPIHKMPATLSMLDNLIPRSYSSPGSWVRNAAGELAPCFLDVGVLPNLDNYDEFYPQATAVGQHLYYYEQDPSVLASNGVRTLRLRALDSKSWQQQYPNLSIIQPLPQSADEVVNGSRRFLFGNQSDLNSSSQILSVMSLGKYSLSASTWYGLDSLGDRVAVTPQNMSASQMAFAAYTDSQHGSLVWVDTNGQLQGRSEFLYQKMGDPFVGKLIAANIIGSEKYWFLQSQENLVGYYQKADGSIHQATIPLDRDSSFETHTFNLMFAADLVGTKANPIPGVTVDSTQIVGNRVNVVSFNSSKSQLLRTLKYSLNIPSHCLNMPPTHLSDDPASFILPLICLPAAANSAFQVNFVQP